MLTQLETKYEDINKLSYTDSITFYDEIFFGIEIKTCLGDIKENPFIDVVIHELLNIKDIFKNEKSIFHALSNIFGEAQFTFFSERDG